MATITPSTAGNPVVYYSASGGGDKYTAGSNARLHVRNGGVAPITVTVASPQPCSQGGTHPLTFVITNGSDEILPAFDPNRHADTNGFINVTYTGVTSVTVAVIA